jgi:hypothetical protein
MAEWIKCPRCELNYIKKEDEYCAVCKAELKKGPQLIFAVDEEEETEKSKILCPICRQNYINAGEQMCRKCASEMDFKNGEIDIDKDDEWKNYLDNDDDDDKEDDEELVSLSKLAEEEDSEMFKDDDEEEEEDLISEAIAEPDDFEIPDVDEADFEYDEEEEEEDDEEEEF